MIDILEPINQNKFRVTYTYLMGSRLLLRNEIS